jgi:hypothetical protein
MNISVDGDAPFKTHAHTLHTTYKHTTHHIHTLHTTHYIQHTAHTTSHAHTHTTLHTLHTTYTTPHCTLHCTLHTHTHTLHNTYTHVEPLWWLPVSWPRFEPENLREQVRSIASMLISRPKCILTDLPRVFTLVSCSTYSHLKMEVICFSETSVDFRRTTRYYIFSCLDVYICA